MGTLHPLYLLSNHAHSVRGSTPVRQVGVEPEQSREARGLGGIAKPLVRPALLCTVRPGAISNWEVRLPQDQSGATASQVRCGLPLQVHESVASDLGAEGGANGISPSPCEGRKGHGLGTNSRDGATEGR